MGSWGLKELSIMEDRWQKQFKSAKTQKEKDDARYWIDKIKEEIRAGFKR